MKVVVPGLRMLAALALFATTVFGVATPATAQGGSGQYGGMVIGATTCDSQGSCWNEIGATFTVTTESGESLGTCTVTGDPNDRSHVAACVVDFPFRPTGTVIVTEGVSTITPGYAPVENPIFLDTSQIGMASHDVVFHNVAQGANASAGQTSDVAIVTTEHGGSATDACYVLVDFSNEGCDENGDGKITFQDVPLGTYTVHQTADLGPGRWVDDFTIQVRGNVGSAGWEEFSATITTTGGSTAPTGSIDISLITRDPDTGGLLTGTCYVLVGYSNEGCDENGDGQVTFDDIPFGTYTVQQTQTPAGYPTINDYPINVEPVQGMPGGGSDVPVGFIVRQAPEQNAPDTRNVSVMLIDVSTNTKLPMDACVQIVDVSNVGCDDDLQDGQIDFLDVQAGEHDIVVTRLPAGYTVANPDDLHVPIDVRTDPANLFVYLYVQRGGV
jgi:uncharacterized surface anchored protein